MAHGLLFVFFPWILQILEAESATQPQGFLRDKLELSEFSLLD